MENIKSPDEHDNAGASGNAPENSSMDFTASPDRAIKIINRAWKGSRILVDLEPSGELLSMPRAKTARQLLEALGLEEESALVAKNGKLLTPDLRIWPGDRLLVRIVASRG